MPGLVAAIASLPALLQALAALGVLAVVVAALLGFAEVSRRGGLAATAVRLVVAVGAPLAALLILNSYPIAAVLAGVAGAVLFWWDRRGVGGPGALLQRWAFLAPAIAVLAVGLAYPTVQTMLLAFRNRRGDRFVGFDNFVWIFSQSESVHTVLTTVVWVLIAPTVATLLGLTYAILIDRRRGERVFRVLLFLPTAISFVGASIIWKFVFADRPAGSAQIGLLNQIIVWCGGAPVGILQAEPWNTLALIAVFIWVQAGLATVLLSAAIKAVPDELIEAAALDGAHAWARFRAVVVPEITPTIVVAVSTLSILALKVFDIVQTMTGGRFGTNVLANEMYDQVRHQDSGRAAAYAVVLLVLVIPIIVANGRALRRRETA